MGFISYSQGSSQPSNVIYPEVKDWEGKITKKTVIIPADKTPREIIIKTNKLCNIYYGKQKASIYQIKNGIFVDYGVNTNVTLEPLEGKTNVKILIRSTKPINYNIGGSMSFPLSVRLCFGTGDNFVDINQDNYDSVTDEYLANLQKLKNSDSGVTGFKIFDLQSFTPMENYLFTIEIDNLANSKYEPSSLAVQLFDPLTIGEVLWGIANDVINGEYGNLPNNFVGSLTRNAYYYGVQETNKIRIKPNWSFHVGRFVAINKNTGKYDTAIIKSYTPDQDDLLGGVFTLTGDF